MQIIDIYVSRVAGCPILPNKALDKLHKVCCNKYTTSNTMKRVVRVLKDTALVAEVVVFVLIIIYGSKIHETDKNNFYTTVTNKAVVTAIKKYRHSYNEYQVF